MEESPMKKLDRICVNKIKGESGRITGMNPKSNFGVLNPPLRGIVQLTNSAALRFRNWSFNNNYCGGS
jgi:hypothetical protein